MLDMFGIEVKEPEVLPPGKRKPTKPNGYAARPGTGPRGEKCKTCAHYMHIQWAKAYLKCGAAKGKWTHGPGSDIRANSPACEKWKAAE